MSYESDDISYKRDYELKDYPNEYRIKQDDKGFYGVYVYKNNVRYTYAGGGWTLQKAVDYLKGITS